MTVGQIRDLVTRCFSETEINRNKTAVFSEGSEK